MKNILIIKNEKDLTNFLEKELNQEGYYTETYSNGRQGLEAALNKVKDWSLIITELVIPENITKIKDGYKIAVEENYRFFSFGDAMLLL